MYIDERIQKAIGGLASLAGQGFHIPNRPQAVPDGVGVSFAVALGAVALEATLVAVMGKLSGIRGQHFAQIVTLLTLSATSFEGTEFGGRDGGV